MSRIPTGYYDMLWVEIIKCIQIYWWLRSPDTRGSGFAWSVYLDGDVHVDYVVDHFSYGRICSTDYPKILYFLWLRSPDMDYIDRYGAWYVTPSGYLDNYDGVTVSHGRKHCRTRLCITIMRLSI